MTQQQEELLELHKKLVDMVAQWCNEHNVEIDEFILRADGFKSSYKCGAWHPSTDSCLSFFKNGQKEPVMESL